ncbi:hypothetical protein [Enterococcus casseliflavus]|uniref:hypothetical protein n=1 Tax=Enterococcus casseliflavus TaxID=37734 RepID=UPI00163D603F|nr:hypothetical protein [Enterococcus casseliflavus]
MFDFWVIALFAVGCWSSFRWLRLQLNEAKNAKYSFHISLLTPVIVIPSSVTTLPTSPSTVHHLFWLAPQANQRDS